MRCYWAKVYVVFPPKRLLIFHAFLSPGALTENNIKWDSTCLLSLIIIYRTLSAAYSIPIRKPWEQVKSKKNREHWWIIQETESHRHKKHSYQKAWETFSINDLISDFEMSESRKNLILPTVKMFFVVCVWLRMALFTVLRATTS